jgi:hypothetical protein
MQMRKAPKGEKRKERDKEQDREDKSSKNKKVMLSNSK